MVWRVGIVAMLVLAFSEEASAECFKISQDYLQFEYVSGGLGIELSPTRETWMVKMTCPTKSASHIEWPQDRNVCPGVLVKVDGQECKVESVARK